MSMIEIILLFTLTFAYIIFNIKVLLYARFYFIFSLSNPAYFLFQETIVYEERIVTIAIACQQEQLAVLMQNVEEIEKTIKNKRVVYIRPPKN